jgi:glutamate synthase (ferredoxin)
VAIGCVMARQCHLNSCPAGIATQKAELRAKYAGTPDQVVTYFRLVAEEVRAILASLGLRSVAELVGRVDLLEVRERGGAVLDVASLLAPVARRDPLDGGIDPEHGPAGRLTLNGRILAEAVERGLGRSLPTVDAGGPETEAGDLFRQRPSEEDPRPQFPHQAPITIRASVRNTDRAVAATLAGAIARAYGDAGCPDTPVRLELTGHAGQSLGAFGVPGLDLHLAGDANDGVAKGLAGGTLVIAPPSDSVLADQALVGNAALYGATGGRLFVAGRAGERFAVRNSGATAVVEGVGHHACEYMTGGIVVVLGPSGRNLAAGMTGGVAYVYDPERSLDARLNPEVVALGGLDGADEVRLADLLRAHLDLTASRRAAALLADWGDTLAAFCKVLPRAAAAGLPARPEEEPERLRA